MTLPSVVKCNLQEDNLLKSSAACTVCGAVHVVWLDRGNGLLVGGVWAQNQGCELLSRLAIS